MDSKTSAAAVAAEVVEEAEVASAEYLGKNSFRSKRDKAF